MSPDSFTALYAQVQVHTYQMERVMSDVAEIRASGAAQVALEKLEQDVIMMMQGQRQLESVIRTMTDPIPTPEPPTPLGFWPSILAAISTPLETWNKLRLRSQAFVFVLILFSLTVLTDGGRELMAHVFGGAANVAENVAEALRGEEEATPLTAEPTERDNPPVAMPPPNE